MIGMHVIMAYGFYKYFHGAREQRYVSSRPTTGSFLRSERPERITIGNLDKCKNEREKKGESGITVTNLI
jgi:hypothetical protein